MVQPLVLGKGKLPEPWDWGPADIDFCVTEEVGERPFRIPHFRGMLFSLAEPFRPLSLFLLLGLLMLCAIVYGQGLDWPSYGLSFYNTCSAFLSAQNTQRCL